MYWWNRLPYKVSIVWSRMLFTHTHTDRRAVGAVKAQHQLYSNHWPSEPPPPQDGHFFLFVFQGVQQKRPSAAQNAILRRYFLELTQSFIIPLVKFLVLFRIRLVFPLHCHLPLHVGLTIKSLTETVTRVMSVCHRSAMWPVWCLCRSPSVPGRVLLCSDRSSSRTSWRRWRKLDLSSRPDSKGTGLDSTGTCTHTDLTHSTHK